MSETQIHNKNEILENRKQYYLKNRYKILQRNKQYYYDNKEERQRYNNEYWALNGHKYVEKRRKDEKYKLKQSEYYRKCPGRPKYKYQDNISKSSIINEIIVYFN